MGIVRAVNCTRICMYILYICKHKRTLNIYTYIKAQLDSSLVTIGIDYETKKIKKRQKIPILQNVGPPSTFKLFSNFRRRKMSKAPFQ